jgi:hypothetical protein
MRTEDNNHTAERWLDDALKQYGEAEPRPGLENRVLANLHTEQARLTLRPWYWRPVIAAVMIAVFVIGAFLLKRRPDVTRATISNRPSIALGNSEPEHPIASAVRPHVALKQPVRSRPGSHIAHSSSVPRLEQFPTPAPLSEQEEMLARYVRERRQEATMVARARAELLKHELEQFVEQSPSEQPRDLEQ